MLAVGADFADNARLGKGGSGKRFHDGLTLAERTHICWDEVSVGTAEEGAGAAR